MREEGNRSIEPREESGWLPLSGVGHGGMRVPSAEAEDLAEAAGVGRESYEFGLVVIS